jgi:hypothetical protein
MLTQDQRRFADLQFQRWSLLKEDVLKRPPDWLDTLETLEDELQTLHDRMTEDEQDAMRGMGSDLQWAQRQGQRAVLSQPLPFDEIAMKQAYILADHLQALRHVRNLASQLPNTLDQRLRVAMLRYVAYSNLDLPDYAQVFGSFSTPLTEDLP